MTDKIYDEKNKECKDIFELFDKDGEEVIETKDLGKVFSYLGVNPTEEEIKKLVNKTDPNKTGKIDLKVFLELYSNTIKDPITEEEFVDALSSFVKGSDDYISAAEFRHTITTIGNKLTEEEADEIMREADINGNGNIDIKKFAKKLMSK